MVRTCKTCKHHDDFSWVCCNPESSYVGDFTDNEDWCSHYENDGSDTGLSQPVIQVLDRMGCGEVFEVVDMPKCECKWYFNENGEYRKYED